MSADYSAKASIGLVKHVRAGVFRMGSRFHPREDPPRLMQTSDFQMAHIPVTVDQYKIFIDSKAFKDEQWWSKEGAAWLHGHSDGWGREDRSLPDGWEAQVRKPYRPITGVNVYEAEAYCKWLGNIKNKIIRLPSEVEWEYAARGTDGRPFPWGEILQEKFANIATDEVMELSDAGKYTNDVSPFGIMEMCGNAQEWTSSTYIPIGQEIVPPGTLRVARGGSFYDTAFGSRTSYRRPYPCGYFYPYLGFRLVVDIV